MFFDDDGSLDPFEDRNDNGYYDAEDRLDYETRFGDDEEMEGSDDPDEDDED